MIHVKCEGFDQLPKDLQDEILKNDPSASRYCVKFMVEQLAKGHRKEDLFPTVNLYWKIKERFPVEQRELYYWDDLKKLEDACKDLGPSNRSKRKIVKNEGATELYRDSSATLVRLESKEGAVFWGKNTRWCISMENADYYNQYVSENKQRLYVVAYENGEKEAFLVTHVPESPYGPYHRFTIYNAQDQVIYDDDEPPANKLKLICMTMVHYKADSMVDVDLLKSQLETLGKDVSMSNMIDYVLANQPQINKALSRVVKIEDKEITQFHLSKLSDEEIERMKRLAIEGKIESVLNPI
jgi:hypothetical protein